MNAMRAGIPRELAAVVRRAMEKKPEDRYPTTREMVDAIDAIPQTAEERRQGEDMLRSLAHGAKLPRVQTAAAPTLTTSAHAGDLRLSGVLRMARGSSGKNGWLIGTILGALLVLLVGGGAMAARAYFGPEGATRRAVRRAVGRGARVLAARPRCRGAGSGSSSWTCGDRIRLS